MRVAEAKARDMARRAFRRAGVPEAQAWDAAEILTLAEMMGIATHGLARVSDYVRRIDAGGIDASSEPDVAAPAPALRVVDGRNGLGPAVARRALTEAMLVAEAQGIGAAFCRRSSHLGALSPYLWLAAERGFACIASTNTAPMIAPAGGHEARVGNNPLGLAIPHPRGTHVILDMALSVVSRSRVRAAAKSGVPIAEDWATDAEGRPTSDPAEALRGLMRAIGDDKGANLGLCLDLLAGALSGASILTEIPNAKKNPEAPQNLGHMILVLDSRRFMPRQDLERRMDDAVRIVSDTPPIDLAYPVRLPGARAIEAMNMARETGLDLAPDILSDLRALSD